MKESQHENLAFCLFCSDNVSFAAGAAFNPGQSLRLFKWLWVLGFANNFGFIDLVRFENDYKRNSQSYHNNRNNSTNF